MKDDEFKMEEVLPDVFDTGNGTAFIWIEEDRDQRRAVEFVTKNKEAWQKKFPNKRIIAMCAFDYNIDIYYAYTYAATSGVLIHYEYVK